MQIYTQRQSKVTSIQISNRFKRTGYSLDIMRQTACPDLNEIMVEGYAAIFSCTAEVQASHSMTDLM